MTGPAGKGSAKVAADALSAAASERDAEIASMRSLLDTVYECERKLIAQRDAALAKLARLREPDVREAVEQALEFYLPHRAERTAGADATLTKIAEMLK